MTRQRKYDPYPIAYSPDDAPDDVYKKILEGQIIMGLQIIKRDYKCKLEEILNTANEPNLQKEFLYLFKMLEEYEKLVDKISEKRLALFLSARLSRKI